MNQPHCSGEARDLVLASGSPRRRELIRSLGIACRYDVSEAPERIEGGLSIGAIVEGLAVQKAKEVAGLYASALIVAADTLVGLDGEVLGKPQDRDDARRMLRRLSGRGHRVSTGLVLLDAASDTVDSVVVETDVYFRELPASQIEAYLHTPEPYDKAGAYGAQGLGATLISRIDGDYFNVVGLPLAALDELLRRAGCCILCRRGAAAEDVAPA